MIGGFITGSRSRHVACIQYILVVLALLQTQMDEMKIRGCTCMKVCSAVNKRSQMLKVINAIVMSGMGGSERQPSPGSPL